MHDLKNKNLIDLFYLYFNAVNINKDLILGTLLVLIHLLYTLLIILAIFLCNNILHLFIILIIISLNIVSIYLLKICPLELFETKHLNNSAFKLLFNYKDPSETTDKKNANKSSKNILEYIIICWLIFAMKILAYVLLQK
jgi:hypothetical protein